MRGGEVLQGRLGSLLAILDRIELPAKEYGQNQHDQAESDDEIYDV